MPTAPGLVNGPAVPLPVLVEEAAAEEGVSGGGGGGGGGGGRDPPKACALGDSHSCQGVHGTAQRSAGGHLGEIITRLIWAVRSSHLLDRPHLIWNLTIV